MALFNADTFEIPSLNPAGWPFVAGATAAWAVLAWLLGTFGFFIGLMFAAWIVYFFRDPSRVTPIGASLVISPADGKVCAVGEAVPPAELGMGSDPLPRISIFLNVFDVHVNRAPMDGTIVGVYSAGDKRLSAADPRASDENKRLSVRQRLNDGREIAYVQIAGLVAWQIINTLKPEQKVQAGERFGIIRFGSRADVFLPKGTTSLVVKGQRMVGGETVLADLSSTAPDRLGAVR